MSFTIDTSTVMPRSLNEPVWLLPHCLIQSSSSPSWRPYPFAQNRFVLPSYIDTTCSLSTFGSTHSFLPQTPEPYGHWLQCPGPRNNPFHSAAAGLPAPF